MLVQNAGVGEGNVNKTPRPDNMRKRRMKGEIEARHEHGKKIQRVSRQFDIHFSQYFQLSQHLGYINPATCEDVTKINN